MYFVSAELKPKSGKWTVRGHRLSSHEAEPRSQHFYCTNFSNWRLQFITENFQIKQDSCNKYNLYSPWRKFHLKLLKALLEQTSFASFQKSDSSRWTIITCGKFRGTASSHPAFCPAAQGGRGVSDEFCLVMHLYVCSSCRTGIFFFFFCKGSFEKVNFGFQRL